MATACAGRIGPNALLQLAAVLDRANGPLTVSRLLELAGIEALPGNDSMVDEAAVASVHQALRFELPAIEARAIAREAGLATGDYILSHRIPGAVRVVLRILPAPISARLLAAAIARHAWTFAGSGRFTVASSRPPVFEIADNPVVRGEVSPTPVCQWHAAVFERLYVCLVDSRYRARETACCACGDASCRFELSIRPRSS